MARKTFTPVYEEEESVIRDRILARISDVWRKELGDFIFDAVAAVPLEIKQEEIGLDQVLKGRFAQYAEGTELDECLADVGLARGEATYNRRILSLTADAGVVIPAGHTASVVILDVDGNPLEYTVDLLVTFATASTQNVEITCKTAGTAGNVHAGSSFILLPPIPGVRTILDSGTTLAAQDTESDEAAYERFYDKVTNPDTGGNRNDYVRWAELVTGVGRAMCTPRWNGNNMVKVTIVGDDMLPASPELVADVQEVLDPGSTGLGDGKAPAGAQVTVNSASGLVLDIVADVMYEAGYGPSGVAVEFSATIRTYINTLIFTVYPVLYAKIGALLMATEGVYNQTGLTVNGGTEDIAPAAEQVAVLGTVTI
jgi:uncharacterized phage protein gp47/JayE